MNNRLVLPLCCAVIVSACAAVMSGHFSSDAFYQSEFPYRVRFAQGQSLLGSDWSLDNFYVDRRGKQKPKDGAGYIERVGIDLDGDGRSDGRVKVPVYDLKLVHRRTDAVVWISTIPLPARWAETDLAVVATSYVEAAAGTGYVVTDLGLLQQAQYSTRVVSQRALTLWNRPAFEVSFEVANINQLELSDASRSRNVRILLVRPPYGWRVKASQPEVPMLMVVGLSARPENFSASIPALEQLVNQVDLGYDDTINRQASRVVACMRGARSVYVELNVSPDGEITSIKKISVPTDKPTTRRSADQRTCVASALAGERLAATGESRKLKWFFEGSAGAPRPPAPYATLAPAAVEPAPVAVVAASAADQPAATAATIEPSAPVPALAATPQEIDAALRAGITASRDAVLACVGLPRLAVNIRYEAGAVTASLRRPLTGTPEEQCVQHELRELTVPATATGTLIHVID